MNATSNGRKPYVRIETVTPKKAAEWLKRNTHNRTLNTDRVHQIAGAILRGEWELGGDSFVFDTFDRLANAQHRCHGIIEAGVPIQAVVLYNASPSAQETMDSGMKRNTPQKLALRGESQVKDLAGALRLAFAYDVHSMVDTRAQKLITDAQLFGYLNDNPSIRDHVAASGRLRKAFLTPGGNWAGWTFLFVRETNRPEYVQAFVDGLVSGADLSPGSPVLALRQLLMKQRALAGDRRFGKTLVAALIVKAFNSYCLGQEMKLLKWDVREEFPLIVKEEDLP